MKKFHMLLPLLAILLSSWSNPTIAQEATDQNRVIIIKKSIDENGVETIEKTIKEGSNVDVFTWSNQNGEEMSFDLNDIEKDIQIRINGDNGEESFSWSSDDSNLEGLKERLKELDSRMNNENGNLYLNFNENNVFNSCHDKNKPFLGVVMEESVQNENGVETIEGSSAQGVTIQDVVKGSAAAAAGLQPSDIITAIDGQSTTRISNVSKAIKAKKVGDEITISYIRNGNSMQTTATLKNKIYNKQRSIRSNRRHFDVDVNRTYSYKVDPCKVFIGVYTGTGHDSRGLRVSGVIEDTPAFDAGLIKGDRILALDGVQVTSHNELLAERNKHSQGDEFTITYVRDGQTNTVDAKFKECKEEKIVEPQVEEEIKENIEEEAIERNRTNNMLDINLKAFPNPTSSSVNVRFVGERTPTVVTATDIKGKEIYREELNNFDGLYNKKINLSGAASGAVIITVRQGNKISSEKVLYTPDRA